MPFRSDHRHYMVMAIFICALRYYTPYGGGLGHLHRSPASRKRRHKEPSLKWDCEMWYQVLRDLNLRVTALARPISTSTSKLQIHPLVRGKCLQIISVKEMKNWSSAPDGDPDIRTDSPTGRLSWSDFDFDLTYSHGRALEKCANHVCNIYLTHCWRYFVVNESKLE
jgi:hypothetical protein